MEVPTNTVRVARVRGNGPRRFGPALLAFRWGLVFLDFPFLLLLGMSLACSSTQEEKIGTESLPCSPPAGLRAA